MRLAAAGPHTHVVVKRVTSSALIGRRVELTAAVEAATSVHSGQARIVLIAGDAGIGKTRLVTEVCLRASQAGMLTAVGGSVQLGEASVAYAPLVGARDATCGDNDKRQNRYEAPHHDHEVCLGA